MRISFIIISSVFVLSAITCKKADTKKITKKQGPQKISFVKELYGIDVMTTATASKWITGKGAMPKDEIKKKIIEKLIGKKMYILATSYKDRPVSTTIEYTLDPKTMVLYGFSEAGTEKLHHMGKNPYVSLNWHEEYINDWTKGFCIQIRGTVELYRGKSKEMSRAIELYPLPYMFWVEMNAKNLGMSIFSKPLLGALKGFVEKKMVMSRIKIKQVVLHDGSLPFKGYKMRQLWTRD